jgi:hypothetical protein
MVKVRKSTSDLNEGFDPRMLISAVKEQAPEFPWLPYALEHCGVGIWRSRAYVQYVSSHNPNQPGSDWQFEVNVVLNHDQLGMVVLDILKGDQLGGIEFVHKIEP